MNVVHVPRRGRPSIEQAAAIDKIILAAAKALFLELGYDAVSMENVAQTAGVSKNTLYARFATKTDLFEHFARTNLAIWAEQSRKRDPITAKDIDGRLRHHAYSIAAALVDPEISAFRRIIIAAADKFPELAVIAYSAGYRYIVDLITSSVEAESQRSRVPVRNAAIVAETLVGGLTGWYSHESPIRHVTFTELKSRADYLVDYLLAARAAW